MSDRRGPGCRVKSGSLQKYCHASVVRLWRVVKDCVLLPRHTPQLLPIIRKPSHESDRNWDDDVAAGKEGRTEAESERERERERMCVCVCTGKC